MIAYQIENEYTGRSAADLQYLANLEQQAHSDGIAVPLTFNQCCGRDAVPVRARFPSPFNPYVRCLRAAGRAAELLRCNCDEGATFASRYGPHACSLPRDSITADQALKTLRSACRFRYMSLAARAFVSMSALLRRL